MSYCIQLLVLHIFTQPVYWWECLPVYRPKYPRYCPRRPQIQPPECAQTGSQLVPAGAGPVKPGCVSPWQPWANPYASAAADQSSYDAEAAAAAAATEAAPTTAAGLHEPHEWWNRDSCPHIRTAAAAHVHDAGHQLPPDGSTG